MCANPCVLLGCSFFFYIGHLCKDSFLCLNRLPYNFKKNNNNKFEKNINFEK